MPAPVAHIAAKSLVCAAVDVVVTGARPGDDAGKGVRLRGTSF